jgi:hypothetical protein
LRGLRRQPPLKKKAYKDAIDALDKFKNKIYDSSPNAISPSTLAGQFLAKYEPLPQVLTISVKCKIEVKRVSYRGLTEEEIQKAIKEGRVPVFTEIVEDVTPDELKVWKENFFTQSLYWDTAFRFHCQKDWWEELAATTFIRFSEASSSESPQINIWVYKKLESLPNAREEVKMNNGYFYKDSLNIDIRHEIGHMFGLDDEYGYDGQPVRHSALVEREFGHPILAERWRKDSIMYSHNGTVIYMEHGVTFLEALRKITGMQEWKFTRKSPRPIPN